MEHHYHGLEQQQTIYGLLTALRDLKIISYEFGWELSNSQAGADPVLVVIT